MGKLVVDDTHHTGKIMVPSTITITMPDGDMALNIAEALHALLDKAQCGGDFDINGHHIGHDMCNYTITLKRGEPK